MGDVRIERDFAVSQARLFDVLSQRAEITQWWGHDGWTFTTEHMDFSRTGPWHADMQDQDGRRYKLSGVVTRVAAPTSISFTWAWHDPNDNRGPESHVTFTVVESAKGAKLIVDHRELPSDEIAARHEQGWGGPLGRLARMLHMETETKAEKNDA